MSVRLWLQQFIPAVSKGFTQLTVFSFSLLFNSRLMLAYELHVRGEHAELGKPRATFVSPTIIKKTVRGREVSNSPKYNAITNQVRILLICNKRKEKC